mmetsp:Transcript_13581/g.13326  ORF Transcript_13581/g.13326 Transcript_13581/m.13326 type:complete len:118 (-) Transcript_13581:9-362(-)
MLPRVAQKQLGTLQQQPTVAGVGVYFQIRIILFPNPPLIIFNEDPFVYFPFFCLLSIQDLPLQYKHGVISEEFQLWLFAFLVIFQINLLHLGPEDNLLAEGTFGLDLRKNFYRGVLG